MNNNLNNILCLIFDYNLTADCEKKYKQKSVFRLYRKNN